MLKIEGFSGWYRTELWEVTKTLLLMGTLYGTLVIVSSISTAFASGIITSSGSKLSTTVCTGGTLTQNLCMLYQNDYTAYLTPQLSNATTAFSAVFGLTMGVSALKNFLIFTFAPIPILPPFFIFCSLPFGSAAKIFMSNFLEPAGSGYSFVKDVMTMVITPILMIIQMQYDLLPAIVIMGLTLFVPLGVILRAIPFLRGIGGTMIGIGIALSLVYPMLLLVLNVPVTNYLSYVTTVPPPPSTSLCSVLCGVIVSTLITNLISIGGSAAGWGLINTLLGAGNLNNGQAYNTGYSIGMLSSMDSMFPAMNLINAYTLT